MPSAKARVAPRSGARPGSGEQQEQPLPSCTFPADTTDTSDRTPNGVAAPPQGCVRCVSTVRDKGDGFDRIGDFQSGVDHLVFNSVELCGKLGDGVIRRRSALACR